MNNNDSLDNLISRIWEFVISFATALMDAVFLGLWAWGQYCLDGFLNISDLAGISALVLIVFHVVFAISTLAPIIIYIVEDIVTMIRKAKRRMRS